jgi:hypothetical protein
MQPYSFYFLQITPFTYPQQNYERYQTGSIEFNSATVSERNPCGLLNLQSENPTLSPAPTESNKGLYCEVLCASNPSNLVENLNPTALSTPSNNISIVVDKNVYKYAKKNAESNLINQIFSYISIPSKSNPIVERIF